MAANKIRIRLKSYDHEVIDASASKIVDTVIRAGAKVVGPVPLPTEKNIVTMLNCVLAYCLWMSGTDFSRCRDFVDKDHRWLPNALRVSGWSHSIGNMARTVAESHRGWPRYLSRVRTLVSFFRNATWRKWIKQAITMGHLHERLPEGFALDVLDRFSCTIAKWL